MSPCHSLPPSRHIASNALAFAIWDGAPVSPCHARVAPRRLVDTWFDATRAEQRALMDLVEEVKARVDEALRPGGINLGFNAGVAAGQAVLHLHRHAIPRFHGDVPDPRGGVRAVVPDRANYTTWDGPWPLPVGINPSAPLASPEPAPRRLRR